MKEVIIDNKIPKRLQGKVIATSSSETIKVRVERKFQHKLYKKIITKHKNYLVQCVDETVVVGDMVVIEEGKPLSKSKSFYFIEKIVKN